MARSIGDCGGRRYRRTCSDDARRHLTRHRANVCATPPRRRLRAPRPPPCSLALARGRLPAPPARRHCPSGAGTGGRLGAPARVADGLAHHAYRLTRLPLTSAADTIGGRPVADDTLERPVDGAGARGGSATAAGARSRIAASPTRRARRSRPWRAGCSAPSRASSVVGGINADFFLFAPNGVLAGPHVHGGAVIAGPGERAAVALDSAGRLHVARFGTRGIVAAGSDTLVIGGWNHSAARRPLVRRRLAWPHRQPAGVGGARDRRPRAGVAPRARRQRSAGRARDAALGPIARPRARRVAGAARARARLRARPYRRADRHARRVARALSPDARGRAAMACCCATARSRRPSTPPVRRRSRAAATRAPPSAGTRAGAACCWSRWTGGSRATASA